MDILPNRVESGSVNRDCESTKRERQMRALSEDPVVSGCEVN